MVGEARLVDDGMPHGPSPYEPLSDDIIRYSFQGEVFLVGDFNARTRCRQCTVFQMNRNLEMVNVDPLDIGTTHRSKDQGADAIYNGLAKWPGGAHMFPTWRRGKHN